MDEVERRERRRMGIFGNATIFADNDTKKFMKPYIWYCGLDQPIFFSILK
jgi:hypothetical protein